mgnify:CR=1 FL=1
MASALFGSTAIGYGDLFDRKVDDNRLLSYDKNAPLTTTIN